MKMYFTLHSPTGLEPDYQETVHGSVQRQLHLKKGNKKNCTGGIKETSSIKKTYSHVAHFFKVVLLVAPRRRVSRAM